MNRRFANSKFIFHFISRTYLEIPLYPPWKPPETGKKKHFCYKGNLYTITQYKKTLLESDNLLWYSDWILPGFATAHIASVYALARVCSAGPKSFFIHDRSVSNSVYSYPTLDVDDEADGQRWEGKGMVSGAVGLRG